MKSKFNSMGRVAIALVLALSLSLVMAVPVAAVVTEAAVTLDKSVVSLDTKYTIEFTVHEGLSVDTSSITVTFPDDTTVKETGWVTGDITVGAADVLAANVTVADVTEPIVGQAVTFITPALVPAHAKATVIFTLNAAIKNPSTAGTYQLYVCTDAEPTDVPSEEYSITAPPGPVDVYNAADPMVYQAHYDTITLALAHSGIASGWTLRVHADTDKGGNYNSSLEVYPLQLDLDGVIVESYDGAASTTIDGDGMMGPGVRITAPDVRLQGFTITNFTCTPYAPPLYPSGAGMGAIWATGDGVVIDANTIYNIRSTVTPEELEAADQDPSMWPAGIGIDVAASDVEVTNNTVYDVDSIGIRIRSNYEEVWPGTTLMTGILVEGNTVHDTANTCFVVAGNVADVTIKGNEIYGSLSPNPYSLWILTHPGGTPTNVTVEGNPISGGYANVRVQGANSIAISGNTITGAIPHCDNPLTTEGKNISIEGDSYDITITNNDILGADGYGVYITGNVDVSTITINYNDISGNIDYGVLNEIATDVDAKYNFWGEIGGPSDDPAVTDTTALGNGDIVSKDVLYDPWLTETQAKTVSDGIAYFGSTTPLQVGWNTLSVPLKLKDSANTLTDIAALGDFLTDTNWEIAYQYNPELTPEYGGWENIGTSDIDLVPCRGYYIKILGTDAVNFPVLYSGALGLPALDLAAGWNLVGSGFGIDRVESPDGDYGIAGTGQTDGKEKVDFALDSIKAKCSIVVSPTMPGQTDTAGWAVLVSDKTTEMIVGEAYWVFMTDSATYAGFEVTPIYKVF